MNWEIEVTYDIPKDRIMSAVKSGLKYISLNWGDVRMVPSVIETMWEITETEVNHPEDHVNLLGSVSIKSGVRQLAVEDPEAFANLMTPTKWDEHTGHLIIQYALWGEERYV